MRLIKRIITVALTGSILLMTASCASEAKPAEDSEPANSTKKGSSLSSASDQDTSTEENISQDIHVNQVGYNSTDTKIAVITGTFKEFSVIDSATKKVVLSKQTSGKISDTSSEDTVCHADFSELTAKGSYYISIAGLGRSYDFKIGDSSMFSEVNSALVKALYYQRCGVALEKEYAGDYVHGACHTEDALLYGNESISIDVSGGWHDAGDYGKYVVPAAVTAADLMLAYEFYPGSFTTRLNIPESKNSNMPDILSEVKYGLQWMLKMQDVQSGGVYHKVTTKNFPDLNLMPEEDVNDLVVLPVSTTATGDFAAVTAMAARIYKDFDAAFAQQCLTASLKAWAWLEANKEFVEYKNPQDVSTGEYGDDSGNDERAWAAAELLRTTGEQKYRDYFNSIFAADGFGLGWQSVSGYAAIAYLFTDADKVDTDKAESIKKTWLEKADMFVKTAEKDGYILAMHKMEYVWGSNMIVANHAMHLLIADRLSSNKKYTETAENCVHYLLGRNTLNQCYITGFGSKTVLQPHHRPSVGDGVKDPVPGMLAGGPASGLQDDIAKSELVGKPPAKCYVDHIDSYSTNEIATYWNSAAVFPFAYMSSK